MTIWDRESADFIVKDVEARAEAFRKFLRDQHTGVPIGQTDVDDETWATYFESKIVESPPIPLVNETTGREFVASPFLLALEYADGGREALRRYQRIRGFTKEPD